MGIVLEMFHAYCRALDVLESSKMQKLHLSTRAIKELKDHVLQYPHESVTLANSATSEDGLPHLFNIDGYHFVISEIKTEESISIPTQ